VVSCSQTAENDFGLNRNLKLERDSLYCLFFMLSYVTKMVCGLVGFCRQASDTVMELDGGPHFYSTSRKQAS